jgi:VWFA-related protein
MKIIKLSAMALLTIALVSAAPGSQQDKIQAPIIQHEVQVTLKLVQVYVTDKRGRSVTDLTAADFELLDNKRPQKITEYEKHLLLDLERSRTIATEGKPVPTAAPVRLNRKFILFFDIIRNDVRGLATSKKAALNFLEKRLLPSDEVAVCSIAPIQGLVIQSPLTQDHEKVREIIRKMKTIPALTGRESPAMEGVAREDEDVFDIATGDPEGLQQYQLSTKKEDTWNPLIQYSRYLMDFARSLRYIQGNKNIIFFSSGIPAIYLRPELKSTESGFFIESEYHPAVMTLHKDMIKEFAASGSTVFTINTEGGRAYFKDNDWRGIDSLREFSAGSGGGYFGDIDKYETINNDINNITGNYYILGFYVDESWDGKFHDIKVSVKRKGVEVHAQRGYYNPVPFNELSGLEKQIQLLDLVLNETPHSRVESTFGLVALPCPETGGKNCVITAEIDVDELAGAASPKAEVVSVILDGKGGIVESQRGEIDFSSLPGRNIVHYSFASLPAGEYTCRLVIRNPETGKAAKGSSRVTVPGPAGPGVAAWPPLLFEPEKKARYLRSSEKAGAGRQIISLNDIYRLIAPDAGLIVEKVNAGTEKILAIFPCEIKETVSPELRISMSLAAAAAYGNIPLAHKVISFKKDGSKGFFLLELDLPPLNAGDYTLNFIISELSTKTEIEVARPIKIVSKD